MRPFLSACAKKKLRGDGLHGGEIVADGAKAMQRKSGKGAGSSFFSFAANAGGVRQKLEV